MEKKLNPEELLVFNSLNYAWQKLNSYKRRIAIRLTILGLVERRLVKRGYEYRKANIRLMAG